MKYEIRLDDEDIKKAIIAYVKKEMDLDMKTVNLQYHAPSSDPREPGSAYYSARVSA